MERKVGGEVHFDEVQSVFVFRDGLVVSLLTCPRVSMAREHWRANGVCHCRSAA